MTPKETDTELPVNVQESPEEAWVTTAGMGALNATVHAWELSKELAIIFITSIMVWLQVKQHGGNTALPRNRKLD